MVHWEGVTKPVVLLYIAFVCDVLILLSITLDSVILEACRTQKVNLLSTSTGPCCLPSYELYVVFCHTRTVGEGMRDCGGRGESWMTLLPA